MSRYDWDTTIAYAVCMAESGGNPTAINWHDKHNGCTGSAGLMQVACIHTGGQHELDPERNMAVAYSVYQRRGWAAWGAFTNESYKRFL